jgi:hypothetical protein
MPKTIKLEPHLDKEVLKDRYRKARDPVLRSHYHIVWLISSGMSTSQVMEVTGYSRGWIQLIKSTAWTPLHILMFATASQYAREDEYNSRTKPGQS